MADLADRSPAAKREEEILAFWRKNDIFKKSEDKDAPRGDYVFYDGPPFANGLPHYGHILAGTIKDAIPRYRTMRGYRVKRRWGWDCHGLPVENLVEKELGLKTRKDIENFGIENFNERARVSIMQDRDAWMEIIPRLGRWVDMEHDYKTMDTTYTESVWWAISELNRKKLLYEGFKSMHLCPRCETTLSNFEVSQGYKDITDISVYVRFPIVGEDSALIAWTTTPWTLPGNAALAVNPTLEYVKFKKNEEPAGQFIVAAPAFERRFKAMSGVSEVARIPGKSLVGKRYKPLFSYYAEDKSIKHRDRGWRVYAADFVSSEEGTGVVHIAPAFGADDLALSEREKLPFVQHVTHDGRFSPKVSDFAGVPVKPKDDHQSGDVLIIKYLAKVGRLFDKEKITHSYPHCWRCDTPLLNYAATSWFVNVPKIKDKLVSENRKVHWVPREIGEYRFGAWLENAREWAISRTRFWGAPLPIWKGKGGEIVLVGSIEELKKRTKKSGNTYLLMRHGEAKSNVEKVLNSDPLKANPLTDKGKLEVETAAETLRAKKISRIITSPLARTKETAEIVRSILGLSMDRVEVDERLREVGFGVFEGKPVKEYHRSFRSITEQLTKGVDGVELYRDVKRRVGAALYDLEKKYENEIVLIISHDTPTWLLSAAAHGASITECGGLKASLEEDFLRNAEVSELSFVPLPHNSDFELDLHRPYIDSIELVGKKGETLKRIPDVFDCWFESGSMPYGQFHYPFENRDLFEPRGGLLRRSRGYPADFIAEGLDQTRGWFYSLIVLGVALFGKSPYKNVIVNGTILAEDGQKMSKRLKNYPDPMDIVARYGADALRYYLIASPLLRGEDANFSERGVGEVGNKILGRLGNVFTFLELAGTTPQTGTPPKPDTVLDRWILSRLHELINETTAGFEAYELDRAARPLADFVDDLSTWYVRRSRERLRGEGGAEARAVLAHVLRTTALLIAPLAPFFAEHLYLKLRGSSDPESVHLADWPANGVSDRAVLHDMQETRRIVSAALEARAKAGIKVRQPLASLTITNSVELSHEYLELVRDEVNVKEVRQQKGEFVVSLDTTISDELREEGDVREVIRAIQDARKLSKLVPQDRVEISINSDGATRTFIERHKKAILAATNASALNFRHLEGESVELSRGTVRLTVTRT